MEERIDRLIEIEDFVFEGSETKCQVWLLGYVFNEEGDLVVDDYAEFVDEYTEENIEEAKLTAIRLGNVRQKLATDSDVVMVQVQVVEVDKDDNEECVEILYEAQVEFTREK